MSDLRSKIIQDDFAGPLFKEGSCVLATIREVGVRKMGYIGRSPDKGYNFAIKVPGEEDTHLVLTIGYGSVITDGRSYIPVVENAFRTEQRKLRKRESQRLEFAMEESERKMKEGTFQLK